MNGMTVAHAKRNFEFGFLTGFSIDSTVGGWLLLLKQKGYSIDLPLLDARQNEPRIFKTLDAAVSAAESVGFDVKRLIG
jgi:hypothetical protein